MEGGGGMVNVDLGEGPSAITLPAVLPIKTSACSFLSLLAKKELTAQREYSSLPRTRPVNRLPLGE